MSELVIYSSIAFVSGFIGNELGHFIKKLQRSLYSKIAIGLFCGFSSMLLVLIIQTRLNDYLVPMAIAIGVFYGFLMSNGKAFDNFE